MLLMNTILPIFLLVLVGYFFAYYCQDAHAVAVYLMKYVFWIAAPTMIFSNISNYHLYQIIDGRFLAAYGLSIFIMLMLTYWVLRLFFKVVNVDALSLSLLSNYRNTLLLGFPLLLSIAGQRAIIPVVVWVLIFNGVLMPVFMFMNAWHHSHDVKRARQSVLQVLKHPWVLATVLGLIFAFLQISLQPFARTTLFYLAASLVPCALVVVGMELNLIKYEKISPKTFIIAFINLLVGPMLAIILSYVFELSDFYTVSLIIFSVLPTAKLKYAFMEELAPIIAITSRLGVFMIPALILLCYVLWPEAFIHLFI